MQEPNGAPISGVSYARTIRRASACCMPYTIFFIGPQNNPCSTYHLSALRTKSPEMADLHADPPEGSIKAIMSEPETRGLIAESNEPGKRKREPITWLGKKVGVHDHA